MHSVFHRQKDVQETDSILSLVHYVIKHDEAKKIMQEDYRDLLTLVTPSERGIVLIDLKYG